VRSADSTAAASGTSKLPTSLFYEAARTSNHTAWFRSSRCRRVCVAERYGNALMGIDQRVFGGVFGTHWERLIIEPAGR
jgi:hypothetical protein